MNDAVKLEPYRKNLTHCLLLILLGLEEVRRLLVHYSGEARGSRGAKRGGGVEMSRYPPRVGVLAI